MWTKQSNQKSQLDHYFHRFCCFFNSCSSLLHSARFLGGTSSRAWPPCIKPPSICLLRGRGSLRVEPKGPPAGRTTWWLTYTPSCWTFTQREWGAWESASRPASRIRFLSDSRISARRSLLLLSERIWVFIYLWVRRVNKSTSEGEIDCFGKVLGDSLETGSNTKRVVGLFACKSQAVRE